MCELYKSDKELYKNSRHNRDYLYIVGISKDAGSL
jgi:23S rRNA maturation-related 3'-5' exoribonuclease YhaM